MMATLRQAPSQPQPNRSSKRRTAAATGEYIARSRASAWAARCTLAHAGAVGSPACREVTELPRERETRALEALRPAGADRPPCARSAVETARGRPAVPQAARRAG